MPIVLYNSLSQQKEEFVPLHPNKVSMYVCGPTVYSDPHIGHAKTYVSFDVMLRYLKHQGFKTFYVQNITDVGHLLGDDNEGEDRILKKAREADQEPMAIAEYYAYRYFEVMDRLGVQRPDISPRATGHIPEQLELIQDLMERGYAYEVNGSVYFNVAKYPEYAALSNRDTEEMKSGTRVEVRSEKQNSQDFALWKRAEGGHLMRWRDPWSGWGYPGWHTECVAMSSKYLGDTFDIHGGGMDLKFPHHDSEIAQARCTDKGFARYWMHSNMLTISGQKMSKSLGNFITLHDACDEFDPLTIRYFCVASHYRSVVDYSQDALVGAQTALLRLHQVTQALRDRLPENVKPTHQHFQDYRDRFCEAMDDDFSTPQALAVLFELSKEANVLLRSETPDPSRIADAEHLFTSLGGTVLGIIPTEIITHHKADERLADVMELMIDLRQHFRKNKDFAMSDQVRDRLKNIGIQLQDSKDGCSWEWIES